MLASVPFRFLRAGSIRLAAAVPVSAVAGTRYAAQQMAMLDSEVARR